MKYSVQKKTYFGLVECQKFDTKEKAVEYIKARTEKYGGKFVIVFTN